MNAFDASARSAAPAPRRAALPLRAAPAALALAALIVASSSRPARADDLADCFRYDADGCPLKKLHCPLIQPPTIYAKSGLLDTSLTVVQREVQCVPQVAASASAPAAGSVSWATWKLRNYVSPVTPEGSFPGPTWRVRKALLADPGATYDATDNPIVKNGTRLRVLLRNSLPNDPTAPIDSCRPEPFQVCSDNPTQVCQCEADDGGCDPAVSGDWVCDVDAPERSCRQAEITQEAPNCFHGPEVTNLHYHGSHVSPQPHSDFVLLSLYSENQVEPPPPDPGDDPTIAIGTYQTEISPFPWNQAPGTHWYHPHKHGSTADQLINGMAGALLIRGELDDDLYDFYGVDPEKPAQLDAFEKVLVIQQIFPEAVFFHAGNKPTGYPPYPLVNGQLIPTIRMHYGEVQRWRLISATSNPAIQGTVQFDFDPAAFPGFEVRQIAQDGVQFAPDNYVRQPLGNAVDGYELSPGNRVDLLVKAPDAPAGAAPAVFYLTQRVTGGVTPAERAAIDAQNRFMNQVSGIAAKGEPQASTGALVRVYVSGHQTPSMSLPAEWPDLPPYLADLAPDAKAVRYVAFSMPNGASGGSTNGDTAQSAFFINGFQYSESCAGETLELGKAETWHLTNNSGPQHPFHIHVNPFQIRSRRWTVHHSDGTSEEMSQTFDPPYPWMDTVALKPGRIDTPSDTVMVYQPEDYTGSYVLHCHFLGHEDRGMMTNVQAVCPTTGGATTSPIQFGRRTSSGKPDDCTVAASDAAPQVACPATEPGAGHHSHGGRP